MLVRWFWAVFFLVLSSFNILMGGQCCCGCFLSISEKIGRLLLISQDNNPDLSIYSQKRFTLNLPPELILEILSFLDPSSMVKLSHTSTFYHQLMDNNFWMKQVHKNDYVVWTHSYSNFFIFLANYFYHIGFGRHPQLPELVVYGRDDINPFLPNEKLARKALALGFPKGKSHYEQVQHKKFMLARAEGRRDDQSARSALLDERFLVRRGIPRSLIINVLEQEIPLCEENFD